MKPMIVVVRPGDAGAGDVWLIMPGVGRVGITDTTTEASLCAIYGQANAEPVALTFISAFPTLA